MLFTPSATLPSVNLSMLESSVMSNPVNFHSTTYSLRTCRRISKEDIIHSDEINPSTSFCPSVIKILPVQMATVNIPKDYLAEFRKPQ